ncbi:MAG: phosphatidylserine/phosphatidylglycerophosphate/cardiolipin synthase family protein [Thermoleophilia bacterium]|nr:phosphatidylserine/phosphatidylglycerophosphate/cardiolipin synthase family protein [Thermoleophilia bacterium]
MPLPQTVDETLEADGQSLDVRRRLITGFTVFVVLQVIVAVLISVRAKYAERRRAARRPATYSSMVFEPVKLHEAEDVVQLYMRGDELMRDMIAAIDAAQHEVLFETFIWVNDTSGRTMRDALGRAAARGVRVYVLWDWALSDHSITPEWFPPGVVAYPFKEIKANLDALRLSNLLRDHRKVVVIDNHTSFIGGYNVGDEFLAWRDTHLKLVGVDSRELANAFGDFWNTHVPPLAPRLPNVEGRSWNPHVLVHRNDPSQAIFPIRGMYLEAIDRASERIWLTNAYFVPDRAFRASLTDAARRGVDVRVLLPERSNHPLTDTLAHGMFEDLLHAGVRVFLYRDFMVHAKTALIDREWATVGTANLDRWSMLGNYEINVEVRGTRLVQQMADMYQLDLESAHEITVEGWMKRPARMRVSERILRSLAPLM